MPGHAVQAGSAFGGFIEGLTGGFQDITEFRGKRALTAPLKALQPQIWRTQCLSHFQRLG